MGTKQTANQACSSCPIHNTEQLEKLGISLEQTDFVVALAGNPNTGKSTVFNALTGLRQHTGNWTGKTVSRAEGGFKYKGGNYKIVDLPGTYSLLSTSQDEEIARNFILFGKPDVTVVVVDATRLERNLNLTIQILELTNRAVVCVNLMDEARKNGIEVDARALSRELGVPVVLTSARDNEGITQLLNAIYDVANGNYECKPYKLKKLPESLEEPVNQLMKKLKAGYPNMENARWIAIRLLEGDQSVIKALKNNELDRVER